MRMRALDGDGDWQFGRGVNSYVIDGDAVAQRIATRLRSFVNDCFFDLDAGIDWFQYLGTKNEVGMTLAVKLLILETPGVSALQDVARQLFNTRELRLTYGVSSPYAKSAQRSLGFLTTELGDILTTESGDELIG